MSILILFEVYSFRKRWQEKKCTFAPAYIGKVRLDGTKMNRWNVGWSFDQKPTVIHVKCQSEGTKVGSKISSKDI